MTSWSDPRTWLTSEIVTNTLLNTHLRDNLKHLYEITGRITGRRGGSATNWGTAGGTSQTVTANREEVGVTQGVIAAAANSVTVGASFATPFAGTPHISSLVVVVVSGTAKAQAVATVLTTSGFQINVYDTDAGGAGGTYDIHWRVIGPVA